MKKIFLLIVGNILVFLLLVVAVEGLLAGLVALAPRIPKVFPAIQRYHTRYERRTLHFMPECFRFDPKLSYRLKQGTCSYKSREFEVSLTGNSAGLRDDEADLEGPEIIVLGDSHAMGWGVRQDESFPQQLEKKLGKRVLNAGVPSYGTAREMMLLRELDRSKLKAVIIQYSDNDTKENFPFVNLGYQLRIMSKIHYQNLGRDEKRRVANRPHLKYLREFWPLLFRNLKSGGEKEPSLEKVEKRNQREARYFMNILARSIDLLRGVPIYALEINSYNKNDSGFGENVNIIMERRQNRKAWSDISLEVIDLSKHLTDDHYFRFDDHINAKGHLRVAEVLHDALMNK